MHVAILGRQPNLSMAELERHFGAESISWFSPTTATIDTDNFDSSRFGGTIKAGKINLRLSSTNWRQVSQKIAEAYSEKWRTNDGKITLGISAYGFNIPARDVQKIGILIKKDLKKHDVSLRLIPNAEPALSSATSHHNKLGLSPNKVELLIIRSDSNGVIIAESSGAQNITALARRDQGRPKRDAFVGMLPPKLALMMVNLASSTDHNNNLRLLDPFCGTGVILQEAALIGHPVYGTDLSEKMIRYTRDNISWLEQSHHIKIDWYLHEGDAMNTTWKQPIDLVASETYLGQPFSAPPSPKKLEEVRGNVNHITTTFLKNIHPQLSPGTPLCLAVPAWRGINGRFTHLPLINTLAELGYQPVKFNHINSSDLLYYREDQVVARQLLVITRA